MTGEDAQVDDPDMAYMGLYRSTKAYSAGQVRIPASGNDAASTAPKLKNHVIVIGPGVGVPEVTKSSGSCTTAAIDATSPRVSSLATKWPEWNRANDTADIRVYGGVGACCNDTTKNNETTVTTLGGGTP